MADETRPEGTSPNTAELLARLPPLPDIKRPFFGGPDHLAKDLDTGDLDFLSELISGRSLDFLLSELLAALPDVAESIQNLGPSGLVLQARPSNTINALTVPTQDGAVIIYNLGFYSLLYSVATAFARVVERRSEAPQAVESLCALVDWATSLAKEPRTTPLDLDDAEAGLAANVAAQAQRFAMCHELGHVVAFDRAEAPVQVASVEGVAVRALPDSWQKEYAADRDGFDMFLRVLAAQSKSASAALIGVELFFNVAGMLEESSADESQAHPPPDDRLARLRKQFLEALGEQAPDLAQPAMAVRRVLETFRYLVGEGVRQRRAETAQLLNEAFEAYAAGVSGMTQDQKRAAAKGVAQLLLASPGATLAFLRERIVAPKGGDEPDTGSPERLLALNAALHFEKPLQAVVEVSRLRGS